MKKLVLVVGLILVLAIVFVIVVFDWYSGFYIDFGPNSTRTIYGDFSKAQSFQGKTIVSENVKLLEGASYSAKSFAGNKTLDLKEECVEIQASDSDAFSAREGKVIQINDLIQTNVYYKCMAGTTIGKNECPTYCIISFGKEIS